ncbi:MAG: serine hydrolase domain-containing protein [Bacteroidota bacterium]
MRFIVVTLVALATTASFSHAQDAWPSQVDEIITGTLEFTGLPSIQVAIGHGGSVALSRAYGFADVENTVPATPATRYRTASVSKWFTGTAVMRLVERGAIDLDAPIQTYCPAYPEKDSPITTRQLLSHTSGIRHYEDYDALLETAETDTERRAIEARRDRAIASSVTRYTDVVAPLAVFADDPLLYAPGRGYAYSSFGYRVLGCVLAGAAEQAYNAVLQEEVFDLVGMDATVPDDVQALIPNRATGYDMAGLNDVRRASLRDVSENLPAGGHLSTAEDLVRFALAFDAGDLVTEATIAVMSREPVGPNGEEIPSGYGHGVDLIGRFPGSLGHPGGQAGASCIVVLFPEEDLVVALMSNGGGLGSGDQIVEQIVAVLRPVLDANGTLTP